MSVELEFFIIAPNFLDGPCVILKEKGGARIVPVNIGLLEFNRTVSTLAEENFTRPLTHALIKNVIEQTEGKIHHVEIYRLEYYVYYALLYIERRGKIEAVDCRPIDALLLSYHAQAPIFIAKEVIERCALFLSSTGRIYRIQKNFNQTISDRENNGSKSRKTQDSQAKRAWNQILEHFEPAHFDS